jgi:MYXO-CTERM domain-containing protein
MWLLPYEAVFLLLALALAFAWRMDRRSKKERGK